MNSLQHLLKEVSAIKKRYDKIAEISGENFNVFKILGLSSNEVRTHSAFIAELLNPKGSHGKGSIFLEIFLNSIKINNIDINTAQVEIEKYIGTITEDPPKGGRIDIVVTDELGNEIYIENKIYAGDQEKQLLRYHNNNPKATLIYLTLNGTEPSESSRGNIDIKDIKILSYRDNIKDWLEQCIIKSVNHSILRETLIQYLYLIKHLTFQTLNENMKDELFNTITQSAENLDTAFQIKNVYDSLIKRMRDEFTIEFNKKIEPLFGKPFIKGGYEIKYEQGEDGDGFFYGIKVLKDTIGGKVSENPILVEISNEINKKYPQSRSNHNYLVWFEPFTSRMSSNKNTNIKYEDFTSEIKILFSNDKVYLDNELSKIASEANEQFEFIKKIIDEKF